MALKDLQARNAVPRERAYKLGDGEGLYLLVQPNGSKLWRMKYRFSGREKLLSFGAYPGVGIAAARDLRQQAKANLALGKDPSVHRPGRDYEDEYTFQAVAKRWHDNRKYSLDPDHAVRVWSRLERDVFPALGHLMMTEIKAPDVLNVVRKIEERGALDISRRAKQGIGQVFRFAVASGICESDPTTHLQGALKPRPRVQHMAKLPIAQLPILLSKIDGYQEEGVRRSEITRAALNFALLTWVRTKELRFATKHEFEDLDGPSPVWRIGADRMKMKRDHIVPLSSQAAAIARSRIAAVAGDFVFPGAKYHQPLSENTMLYALYRLGFHTRQTVHGFRGIASTWANEQLVEYGEPPIWMRRYHEDWVELQLAHSEENESRGAYNAAEYLLPRRLMMQDWADFLDRARGASETPRRLYAV